jgi:polysaccharide pyruvyl transferase WcaK-like protein
MPGTPAIVVIADVGEELFHVGDEAMLVANLAQLRRRVPGVRVTVIGTGVQGLEERLGVTALAAPQDLEPGGGALQGPLRASLDDADGLLLSGGGNLSSSWPVLLRQRIVLLREAVERGVPVATGGQTIGPSLASSDECDLSTVLSAARHVGVRELPSAALALRLGVGLDRLAYQADDAFLLAGKPPVGEQEPWPSYLLLTLDPSFAAPGALDGLPGLAHQLATLAAEQGLELTFLPHVGPLGSVGDEDGQVGRLLVELLRAEGLGCRLLPVLPAAEAVWVTQRASLVVSSRYHPIVFAIAGGVPCLGIHRDAYTRIKIQGALAHASAGAAPDAGLDLAETCALSAEAADGGGLLAAGRRTLRQQQDVRSALARARVVIEAREDDRWTTLLGRLLGTPFEAIPETGTLAGWPASSLAAWTLAALGREREALRDAAQRRHRLQARYDEALTYVRSLEAEVEKLRELRSEAERYALSLEEERRARQG